MSGLINRDDMLFLVKRKNAVLLKHMTSLDTVKDMEIIRIALGTVQINFYGLSYGTYLGQLYGTLYPTRVRRMVLDSNVDPRTIWFQANLNQNIGFERNINLWFAWVARYDYVYHLGNKSCAVENRWNMALKQLERTPAVGVIDAAEWIDTYRIATYYQTTWTSLALILSTFSNENNTAYLINWYAVFNEGNDDNSYAVYLAIICTDTKWPRSWKSIRTVSWRSFSRAPSFTWYNSWYNGPCQYWRQKGRTPITIKGNDAGDILLIGETLDAATPYQGSLEVRRRFPKARLIGVINGTNHANSLTINSCVDNIIGKYLGAGELPSRVNGDRADVECEALADPRPILLKSALAKQDIEDFARQYVGRF